MTRLPSPALVAVVLTIAGLLVGRLPSAPFNSASLAAVAAAGEPGVVPAEALFALRLVFTLILGGTVVWSWRPSMAFEVVPQLWAGSRLSPDASLTLRGPGKLLAFTEMTWALQLLYFGATVACTALSWTALPLPAPLAHCVACAVWVAFEVSFGLAILVTACVTFVLIPDTHRRAPADTELHFFNPMALLMHNFNVVTMATELLFNALPIMMAHFPACPLVGLAYVVVSWRVCARTGVVLYPFLDPTLPPSRSVPFHLLLLAAVAAFFGVGALATAAAHLVPVYPRIIAVYAAAASIMTTRTIRGPPKARAA